MKDWSVAVWFYTEKSEKTEPGTTFGKDLRIVGPVRPKEITELLGLALLEFLRQAGANLVAGKDECTFVQE